MSHSREDALELMHEFIESESLRAHCYAVEAVMRAYAKKYGEDEEQWAICGLLHDFDYEKFPDKHPMHGSEILKEKGYDEEIIQAILGHAEYSGVARESQMAKTLFGVDELCGFIVACGKVRPEGLTGLKPKSVKKRLKTKAFAAKVNREEIAKGIEELGVDETEHIAFVIEALQGVSKELGF
jgi:putative nucleotidyltransferase with HDIG domain